MQTENLGIPISFPHKCFFQFANSCWFEYKQQQVYEVNYPKDNRIGDNRAIPAGQGQPARCIMRTRQCHHPYDCRRQECAADKPGPLQMDYLRSNGDIKKTDMKHQQYKTPNYETPNP